MNPETPTAQQQLTQQLIDHIAEHLASGAALVNLNLAVAPTLLHLLTVQQQLQQAKSAVQVIAQDVSRFAGTGAYTGDFSFNFYIDWGQLCVGYRFVPRLPRIRFNWQKRCWNRSVQ